MLFLGAVKLKKTAVQQLSVVGTMLSDDAFFLCKWNKSVRILQVIFGTLDFKHLYDVHRWGFIHTMRKVVHTGLNLFSS